MRYPQGTMIDIPDGTVVRVNYDNELKFVGIIVGKATTSLEQTHIVFCTDGTLPTEVYPYTTAVAPLSAIEVIED